MTGRSKKALGPRRVAYCRRDANDGARAEYGKWGIERRITNQGCRQFETGPRRSMRRPACGTTVRLGIVAADKIASCTSGNAMETGLTVDRGNPARHTEMTVCSTAKNSRYNPSDFSVQQRPGSFQSRAFYLRSYKVALRRQEAGMRSQCFHRSIQSLVVLYAIPCTPCIRGNALGAPVTAPSPQSCI